MSRRPSRVRAATIFTATAASKYRSELSDFQKSRLLTGGGFFMGAASSFESHADSLVLAPRDLTAAAGVIAGDHQIHHPMCPKESQRQRARDRLVIRRIGGLGEQNDVSENHDRPCG